MPRNKRTLAEADLNASAPTPAPKKLSPNPASGKENQNYKSKTVAELTSMLKERGLPHTGKKAELVQRLDETSKTISRAGEATAAADSSNNTALNDPSTWDFITVCRPFHDIVAEKQAINEYYDPDEDKEERPNPCGGGNCMCKRSPKDFPDWKWIITRKGLTMVANLMNEADKRDQDVMGQYQYNDFSGYGFQEVVENHLLSFHKSYTATTPDPRTLWHHIESLAHFLPGDGPWFMSDDSQCLLDTLKLVGHATLATLDILDGHGLLKPASPVKDLPLVLGRLIEVVFDWPGGYDDAALSWTKAVVLKVKARGVEMKGAPWGIEERVRKCEELEEETEGDDEIDDELAEMLQRPDWVGFDWKKEFAAFTRQYKKMGCSTIGGKHYDLSKKKRGGRKVIGMR